MLLTNVDLWTNEELARFVRKEASDSLGDVVILTHKEYEELCRGLSPNPTKIVGRMRSGRITGG